MKCIRCRANEVNKDNIHPLCDECYAKNPHLSDKEVVFSELYEDPLFRKKLMELNNIKTEEQLDNLIDTLLDDYESLNYVNSINTGIDLSELINNDIIDELLNGKKLNLIIRSKLDRTSHCNICGKPKIELCEHIDDVEKIKVLITTRKLDAALEVINQLSDEYYLIGELYRAKVLGMMYKLHDALDILENVANDIFELDEPFYKMGYYAIKFNFLSELEQFDQIQEIIDAINMLHDTMKESEKIECTEWSASVKYTLGRQYALMMSVDLAFKEFIEALKLYVSLPDEFGIAATLEGIATLYLQQEDYLKAEQSFNLARKIYEKYNFDEGIAHVNIGMGHCYLLKGDLDEAAISTENGLNYYDNNPMEDRRGYLGSRIIGSQIYIMLEKFDKAIEMAKEGISVAKELEISREMIFAIISLFNAYIATNKKLEAEKLLEDEKEHLLIFAGEEIYNELKRNIDEMDKLR